MKQIFLKVYPNGKTTTNASVLNFDRENKSGEIVIDYSEVSCLDWDKQLDLIFSDGSTAFVTGSGNTLTVPLLEAYLKKGSMTVQPIAKRLVGAEVEKAKWQVVALSVRDSLNVLENDVTVTVSIAEQMQAEIEEFKDAEAVRVQNEIDRESSEGIRESSEVIRGQNESTRQSNENTRISNEQARVIAEPLRITAEQGRVSAESTRVTQETGRVDAEGLRVNAEQGRASAESTRVTQETGRVNAENVRLSSETLRIENEIARNTFVEYSGSTAYLAGNKVSYLGSSYVAKSNTTGNLPTNTTYWLLIAQKGDNTTANDVTFTPTGNLSSTNVQNALAEIEQEIMSFNEDYVQYKDNNNLKVAKVEKDINDYQSTIATMNPNQEAKQKVTGYGVVSLPKNSANGQVSASVKGLTATNLIKNGNFNNGTADWTSHAQLKYELSATNGLLSCKILQTGDTISSAMFKQLNMQCVSGHKYYISLKVKPKYNSRLRIQFGGNSNNYVDVIANVLQHKSVIITANNNDGTLYFFTDINLYAQNDEIYFDDIMMLDLTAYGLNGLTLDQCNLRFPNWFDGTKSTISASRLKSAGKNLFDKNDNFKEYSTNYFYKEYNVKPNTAYTIKILSVPTDGTTLYLANDYVDAGSGISGQKTVITKEDGKLYVFLKKIEYKKYDYMLNEGNISLPYEPYTESTSYLPNVGELRSLPNGTKDEVRVSGGKAEHIQRNKKYVLQANDMEAITVRTNVDEVYTRIFDIQEFAYSSTLPTQFIVDGKENVIYNNSDNVENIGKATMTGNSKRLRFILTKGTTLAQAKQQLTGLELIYQLDSPIITPIEVSGNLVSYPSGTVYIERVIADAGLYNNGITTQYTTLPIKSIDKVIKYNFATGVQTSLDVSKAVINANKLSFTHSDLINGDMVFFDYFYDVESTEAETEIEYFDSRHTIKDTTNNKFYSWKISSTNGVASVALTEVL